MNILHTSASTIHAILAFIHSGSTPDFAYDDDNLAPALIEKLRGAVGPHTGNVSVSLFFNESETEIYRQFRGCCHNIAEIMDTGADGFNPEQEEEDNLDLFVRDPKLPIEVRYMALLKLTTDISESTARCLVNSHRIYKKYQRYEPGNEIEVMMNAAVEDYIQRL